MAPICKDFFSQAYQDVVRLHKYAASALTKRGDHTAFSNAVSPPVEHRFDLTRIATRYK